MNEKTIQDVLLCAACVAADDSIKHPLDAIAIAASNPRQYSIASTLFLRVCGLDNMDLSRDEMIDDLTAVAMGEWSGLS